MADKESDPIERARERGRAHLQARQESALREDERRSEIDRRLLIDDPIYSAEALKAAADKLRNLGRFDMSCSALDLICAAAKSGAFVGGEWPIWRAQVAAQPAFDVALKNMPANCGVVYSERDWYTPGFTPAKVKLLASIADLIESFIIAVPPKEAESVSTPAKMPKEIALSAYRLWIATGATQTQLAEKLSQVHQKKIGQGQVSRWIKEVKEFVKAGNILPDPPKTSPKILTTDPATIDRGERQDGLTRRQRPQFSDE
jgi:hypothetical protein